MSKFSSPFLAKSPFNQSNTLKKIADEVESWMPTLSPKRKKELDKIQKSNPGMTRGEAREKLRSLKSVGSSSTAGNPPNTTPAGISDNKPDYKPPQEDPTPAGMGDQSVNQWHKNKREWTDIGVSGIPGVPSIRNQK
tara:strand:- start:673 stop:1083 length:411 start_codon:yes stop_codon:yes gene_type:complete